MCDSGGGGVLWGEIICWSLLGIKGLQWCRRVTLEPAKGHENQMHYELQSRMMLIILDAATPRVTRVEDDIFVLS